MKIGGLQKFSLIDYPDHICAIVFTQGCNFRCPYCHNPELVDPARMKPAMDVEKVLAFFHGRRAKLDAVCISGGEPTLQSDLPEFIRELVRQGFRVKLDTNGTNPEMLDLLLKDSLIHYVAMDIKAPLTKYEWVCQKEFPGAVIQRSMDLMRAYQVDREFRTTVVYPLLSVSDVEEIFSLLQKGERYYLQKFSGKKLLLTPSRQYAPFSSMLIHSLSQKAIQKGIHLSVR